jgi:hypothetical protein
MLFGSCILRTLPRGAPLADTASRRIIEASPDGAFRTGPAGVGRPEAAIEVLLYGLDMPVKKRPTPQDAVMARQILLDGLARENGIGELITELASLHSRHDTFPGEVFLRLAADALDWCQASQGDPVPLEGIRERLLSECRFRGRENHKFGFAVLAAAALRGGVEPDLLDEIAWWQTDDFWQYALFAAVTYIRVAADRASIPVPQVCRELSRS